MKHNDINVNLGESVNLNTKLNNNLKIEILKLTNEEKAYIAGFLDGDGTLLTQIVRDNSYKYKFYIRYTIQFVQNKKNHSIMLWLKSKLKVGYIRIKKDNMSEYAITSKFAIVVILQQLLPYLRIKKELGQFILTIINEEKYVKSREDFIKICELVDRTIGYTYSKKRKITSIIVKQYFNSL